MQAQALSTGTKTFVQSAMSKALLEKEEELELARQWLEEDNQAALSRLVTAHGRLAVSLANKFRHYGLPVSDLIQEANIGLLQAANRFDYTRDIRFSTYASWWIKSCIQDYVLRNWSIVRTGTTSSQKSLFFNLRRLRSKIEDNMQMELNEEGRQQIADRLGVKLKEVTTMEARLNQSDQSLSMKCYDDSDLDLQDLLVDDGPTPEDVAGTKLDAEVRSSKLRSALAQLDPRDRHIIAMRRLSEDSITLEALGRDLGISKERVRQLEARAMEKLQDYFDTREHAGLRLTN